MVSRPGDADVGVRLATGSSVVFTRYFMRLLLTSAGIANASIHDALVELLGKPIEECTALCIPTAEYGHPQIGPGLSPWEFVTGTGELKMTQVGWKSVGLLELTALPSIDPERWLPLVHDSDVLLAAGGDSLYLCHWMRECGLADMLPSLDNAVWVGLSGGSMVMTPRIGRAFIGWQPPSGDDAALGVVNFAIYPHLDHPNLPSNTMANAEKWAATLDCPAYAIDDNTAIRVVDGVVDVVSEGQWRHFPTQGSRPGSQWWSRADAAESGLMVRLRRSGCAINSNVGIGQRRTR
jgi:dipeptidase E